MAHKKIAIVGSSNTDMVIQSDHLPVPGETVIGNSFTMNAGGKGANQAVAAARLGGDVMFAARVGKDPFGEKAIEGFRKENIDVRCITVDEELPSGVALILVDQKGENSISVSLGANEALRPEHIMPLISALEKGALILTQLETPVDTVAHLARLAKDHDLKLVLNPAPAQVLPSTILDGLFMITPNAIEAELLSGIKVKDDKSAREAALALKESGVQNVIITMGGAGAYVLGEGLDERIPATLTKVVDTTAAGDTFNGALVVALNQGKTLRAAIELGHKAAAHAVGILGAQNSIPTIDDLNHPS